LRGKFFDQIEKYFSYVLLGLMALIVASATLKVAYVIITRIFRPPGYFIGVEDLFDLFGLFLLVLIGLWLMTCIRMYVKDHTIHAELMMLIAITAITRKIVIIDAKQIDPLIMFGIGFVIISLTAGYSPMRKAGRINVD
jgi:uncharacterized membrane protein (DUF373 family)